MIYMMYAYMETKNEREREREKERSEQLMRSGETPELCMEPRSSRASSDWLPFLRFTGPLFEK